MSTYHLNKNDILHYMCILLQNIKRYPNPHLCSNFQEKYRFKTYACNCFITSPEQFIVISFRTNTQLHFSLHFTPLGHEKLIFCFSGIAAFVLRPPLQNFYPKMVPICLSNRSCFRYRGIIFNSSAYLLQV